MSFRSGEPLQVTVGGQPVTVRLEKVSDLSELNCSRRPATRRLQDCILYINSLICKLFAHSKERFFRPFGEFFGLA